MKAKDALIAWTPVSASLHHASTRGKVKVGPLIGDDDPDWTALYGYTGGAAWVDRRNMEEWQLIAAVFIDFQTLVISYGMDPKVVHEAFLEIDEYAERIAPDQFGSRGVI